MQPRRIAHYEVVDKLGEGGMGVVWKARDPRLNRFVAIKVLPRGQAADQERRARFTQEAQSASALNHPNIITIYEIGEHEGAAYIAMEFVDGRPLDALITPRGMKVPDALKYGSQIADAMAAAHQAGIVHRDLKPSNVMVANSGIVKVLDFGLAKLVQAAPGPDQATLTARPQTEDGMILGTIAYMSPEQAEGRPVDSRSDIFSFGSMLYEMLSGRRPFEGETKLATLSAILKTEPKPIGDLLPPGARELERVVRRCLRKDVSERYQHMDDLKIVLVDLKQESDSGSLFQQAAPPRSAASRVPWLIAGLAAIVAAGAGFMWLRRTEPAAPVAKPVATPTRLSFDTGLTTDPAYWPGGNMIGYASDRATGKNLDIWLQNFNGERRQLTSNDADDHEPSFSPDGSKLVFRSGRDGGGIYVISTLGGAERKVAAGGHYPRFSPDGEWIGYTTGDVSSSLGLAAMVVAAGGGEPRPLGRNSPVYESARFFDWAPDGKHALVSTVSAQGRSFLMQPVAGGDPIPVPFPLRNIADAATWTGNEITFAQAAGDAVNLWSVEIDPASFKLRGDARRLTAGTALESRPARAAGKLVYSALENNIDIWAIPVEGETGRATGEPVRVTSELGADAGPAVSADGTHLAWMSVRGDRTHVMAKDSGSAVTADLISFPAQYRQSASMSPDGAWIGYTVGNDPMNGTAYRIPFQGGAPKRLCDKCEVRDWANDNTHVILGRAGVASKPVLLDVGTGAERTLSEVNGGLISSAGSPWWAAYGPMGVLVAPYRPDKLVKMTDVVFISPGMTDFLPALSVKGEIMYVMSARDGFNCVWAYKLAPVTKKPLGPAFAVQHFHSARYSMAYAGGGRRRLRASRDKLVLTIGERTGNIWMSDIDQAKSR